MALFVVYIVFNFDKIAVPSHFKFIFHLKLARAGLLDQFRPVLTEIVLIRHLNTASFFYEIRTVFQNLILILVNLKYLRQSLLSDVWRALTEGCLRSLLKLTIRPCHHFQFVYFLKVLVVIYLFLRQYVLFLFNLSIEFRHVGDFVEAVVLVDGVFGAEGLVGLVRFSVGGSGVAHYYSLLGAAAVVFSHYLLTLFYEIV